MRKLALVLILMSAVTLAACGSTKVVNQQKTIVYRGDIYNITNVVHMTSSLKALLPENVEIDMQPVTTKAEFNQLVETHGKLAVRSAIHFDDQTLVLEFRHVKSFNDFKKMRSNRDDRMKKIQKFMAGKSNQLKLK